MRSNTEKKPWTILDIPIQKQICNIGKMTIFKGYQKLFRILGVLIIISSTVDFNQFSTVDENIIGVSNFELFTFAPHYVIVLLTLRILNILCHFEICTPFWILSAMLNFVRPFEFCLPFWILTAIFIFSTILNFFRHFKLFQ